MIDLREHSFRIVEWLVDGLARFRSDYPNVPSRHVALYCCPRSGWISLCLDPSVQLDQNCPDFKFVEWALYAAPEWATQYESEGTLAVVDADGVRHVVDVVASGDEALNRIFFEFLRGLLIAPMTLSAIAGVQALPDRLGVQLLDSEYGSSWKPQ